MLSPDTILYPGQVTCRYLRASRKEACMEKDDMKLLSPQPGRKGSPIFRYRDMRPCNTSDQHLEPVSVIVGLR